MTSLLSVIFLGFFLGMRHATDPDHVVAVATIVSRQRSIIGGALVGIFWGIGHTLTILGVGVAIIAFNVVISLRVGLSMELAVAFMLIVLGVLALAGALRPATERPDPEALTHVDRVLGDLSIYRLLRPFVVGIVHGLAGSAAVVLLVLATIREPIWAALYLLVFGAGTIAGMIFITGLLAWPLAHMGQPSSTMRRRLTTVTGVLSLAFGVFLVYQIGIVDGLLTGRLR